MLQNYLLFVGQFGIENLILLNRLKFSAPLVITDVLHYTELVKVHPATAAQTVDVLQRKKNKIMKTVLLGDSEQEGTSAKTSF